MAELPFLTYLTFSLQEAEEAAREAVQQRARERLRRMPHYVLAASLLHSWRHPDDGGALHHVTDDRHGDVQLNAATSGASLRISLCRGLLGPRRWLGAGRRSQRH